MRCVSWNVNGIRAIHRKGLDPTAVVPDADVVCLQETKARPEQVPPALAAPAGWHAHWACAQKPGYSGVAAFSRRRPTEVIVGLGDAVFDVEGRSLTLILRSTAIVCAYFPNSQEGGRRLDYKLAFCAAMEEHLATLRGRGLHTILVGDYNIAHRPIDLARPEANEENPGYLPEERAWMTRYLGLGHHDIFRERHPDLTGAYTWWSYRGRARDRNVGWRLDYCTVDAHLRQRVRGVALHPAVTGSDHCPISIDL